MALAAATAPAASASLTASPAPAPTTTPAATASFTAPVELAAAQFGLAATSATDATGTTIAMITGDGAPKLLERQPGAAWPAPARLPGDPRGMKGPVVAAAGQGALGIAWRVDTPRKYGGIQAEVRDPGGTLSTPIAIADDAANGVRHPALAVDPAGDALLAYNTDTRKSHLSMRGAIAVAYRPAQGSFSAPVEVDDEQSQPPVVALAPDGTGIVAWARTNRVYGVSISRGRLGKVKRLAVSKGIDSLTAAAGPGGEATVAWIGRSDSRRHYEIRALRRFAGHAFGPVRVVRSTRAFVAELALAADETGRTTAAWPEDDFRGPAGMNNITSSVRTVTAAPGHAFGKPRALTASGTRSSQSLSLAAANGRVAVAWGFKRDSHHVGIEATVGRPAALGPPQVIATVTLAGNFFVTTPSARITLAPSGAAIALAVLPSEPAPRQIASRLVAIDG
jgi:hypothetical protein